MRTHRKGPSDFSEWTDMETVAVMSGTGAGAEDTLPGPAGAKDDWLEVREASEGAGRADEDVAGIIRGSCCLGIGDRISGCRFRWMSGRGGGTGGGGGGNCFRSLLV